MSRSSELPESSPPSCRQKPRKRGRKPRTPPQKTCNKPSEPTNAKILDLDEAKARYILWARQSEEEDPFEVTKIVDFIPLTRCPSARRCPEDEPWNAAVDVEEPLLLDCGAPPSDECPYEFFD